MASISLLADTTLPVGSGISDATNTATATVLRLALNARATVEGPPTTATITVQTSSDGATWYDAASATISKCRIVPPECWPAGNILPLPAFAADLLARVKWEIQPGSAPIQMSVVGTSI